MKKNASFSADFDSNIWSKKVKFPPRSLVRDKITGNESVKQRFQFSYTLG